MAGRTPHTIAHILPWPTPGGTEHGTLRIAKSIDRSRFTNIAFCRSDADAVRAFFGEAGVRCTSYEPAEHSYRGSLPFLQASWRLARDLRRHRVELVHCSDLLAAHHAALAGWLARVPVISHIRGRFDDLSLRDRSFLWPVVTFIFVSHSTWRQFAHRVPPSRGVVVYDGIDVQDDPGDDPAAVRRELGIAAGARIVGMSARVAPPKDFATLAEAAVSVLAAAPDVRFVIVGDHSSTAAHREYYSEVQHVLRRCGVADAFVFTGYRPDVSRLLQAFDIFVLSTLREGLPLVILEALAAARPVVATAVDGIPEVIRHEETGLLVPRQDAGSLAARLMALLQDRDYARRLGETGRAFVRSRFSTELFASNMMAVYDAVLNPGSTWRAVLRHNAARSS